MTAREQIPVTPALITWARVRAGYSLDDAAKTFGPIGDWESGKSSPTYPQLERLSDTFKIPVAVFFFPAPPEVPAIQETFRTLPEAEIESFPPRVKYLLRKAKAFQLNLEELTNGTNPAEKQIVRDLEFAPNTSAAAMANSVRDYLGISLAEQEAWVSVEDALENWRAALHSVGVFVFKDAFRAPDFSGFCLYDDTFPLIYVNNTTAKTRQIFTLFHELAHLLFHTSGVDEEADDYIDQLEGDARQIEILCNRFAAEFLLPDAKFDEVRADKEASEDVAVEIAVRFKVSRELVFRKFLERNLITPAEYRTAARRWAAQKKPAPGGDYYNNQIAYLGVPYLHLAFGRYNQNQITEYQLADYLGVPAKNLPNLEVKLTSRRA